MAFTNQNSCVKIKLNALSYIIAKLITKIKYQTEIEWKIQNTENCILEMTLPDHISHSKSRS